MNLQLYALTVILHGTAIALVAALAVTCLRQPRARATAALTGILALGLVPWLSAIRLPDRQIPPALQAPVKALPTWRITLSEPAATPDRPPETVAAPLNAASPISRPPLTLFQILGLIWLTGTVLFLLAGIRTARRLRVWKASLERPTDAEWETLAPLTRLPRDSIYLCDPTISPCVTGLIRPALILPRFLLAPDHHRQLVWALRHEDEHVRGNDLRWIAIFRLIRATCWWNPLVRPLISRWSEAREQLCDLHAARSDEDRADYGRFLIEIGGRSAARLPGTLAMADRGPVSRLKRRLVFLLTSPTDRPVGKRFITAALLLPPSCCCSPAGWRCHPSASIRPRPLLLFRLRWPKLPSLPQRMMHPAKTPGRSHSSSSAPGSSSRTSPPANTATSSAA